MEIVVVIAVVVVILYFLRNKKYSNEIPHLVFKKIKRKLPKDSKYVYFDLEIGGRPLGQVIIELFTEITPYTCENFKQLCLTRYKGTRFHRIIKGFMLQGGDITHGNGMGGYSIYGAEFPDENFLVQHTAPGLLSMANRGPNTNSSQFFITTAPAPHLD